MTTKWMTRTLHSLPLLFLLLFTLAHLAKGIVEDTNGNLVIGLVVNNDDKYNVQDHYILDGAKFFMAWCNNRGGFQYANWTRQVEVITRDASAFTSPQQISYANKYWEMVPSTTLVMSPISTPRTNAAIAVSEKNKQINLAVGASADSLFTAGYQYMFSTVVPTSRIPVHTLTQFVGKVNNYILFSTNDAVSISVTASVQTFMNKSGIPLVGAVNQLVINTTTNAGLEASINYFFQTYLANVTADLFVCTFPPDDFSFVASAFEKAKPNISAAAYVLPLTRTVQQQFQQGKTGDYWVAATQFDPSTPFGVPGEFGGTSAEFYSLFNLYEMHNPDPYAATAAAALMAYYVAVKAAGTVNSDAVRQSMVNMSTFNSFLGDINFFANGSSVYADYLTFQFKDGLGQFINDSSTVVYPSPWPWIIQPTSPPTIAPPTPAPPLPIVKHSKALSIVLGVIIGICVLAALAALILLIVKKELFRKQGIVYCGLILTGVLCTYAAALTTLPNPTDHLCLAFPWLLGVGFTLVFGDRCLFIKTWVLFKIFRSAQKMQKLKSLTLTVAYIARLIIGAVLIEVVFLIVWTTVDPPKAELKTTLDDQRQLMCTRTNSAFWAVFIGYKGLWLIAGIVVSILTRNIRKDYNESKNIVLTVSKLTSFVIEIYNCVIVTIVAVLLAFILPKIPAAITLIEVMAILIVFTFALVVLFATPFTHFIKGTEIELGGSGMSTMSAGSRATGSAGSAYSANSRGRHSANSNNSA